MQHTLQTDIWPLNVTLTFGDWVWVFRMARHLILVNINARLFQTTLMNKEGLDQTRNIPCNRPNYSFSHLWDRGIRIKCLCEIHVILSRIACLTSDTDYFICHEINTIGRWEKSTTPITLWIRNPTLGLRYVKKLGRASFLYKSKPRVGFPYVQLMEVVYSLYL
jgi:hypothetical protein